MAYLPLVSRFKFVFYCVLIFTPLLGFSQESEQDTDSITPPEINPYLTDVPFLSNLEKGIFWIRNLEAHQSENEEQNEGDSPTAINYFNFNPVVSLTSTNYFHENILDDYISLFAVFKSDIENEHSVFELQTRKQTVSITTQNIITDEAIAFEKAKPKQGMLLYYMTGLDGVLGSNALSLEGLLELSQGDSEKHQLMELILIPKLIHSRERAMIESYLSIKYGISLVGERSYINSSKDTVWDYKQQEGFNNEITGIGRDDLIGLYQKQSGNSSKNGLYIGLENIEESNRSNTSVLPNESFLLWGNNNKSTLLQDDNGIERMERVWKTQKTTSFAADTLTLQLLIEKEEFFTTSIKTDKGTHPSPEEGDALPKKLWLVTQSNYNETFDFDTATYIKQSEELEGRIYFDTVQWFDEHTYFTFISAPDFFVDSQIGNPLCSGDDRSPVTINTIGGKAPYQIRVSQDTSTTLYYSDTETYTLDLKTGTYSVTVTDASLNTFEMELIVGGEPDISIELEEIWELEAASVTIMPTITCDNCDPETLTYEWFFNQKSVGQSSELTAYEAGDYSLAVTTSEGCTTTLPFQVKSSALILEGVTLHPNPITSNQSFALQFDLDTENDVHIKIFTPSGQLVKEASLPNIKEGVYTDSLTTSGSYFVVVEADQTTRTFKLIVK